MHRIAPLLTAIGSRETQEAGKGIGEQGKGKEG